MILCKSSHPFLFMSISLAVLFGCPQAVAAEAPPSTAYPSLSILELASSLFNSASSFLSTSSNFLLSSQQFSLSIEDSIPYETRVYWMRHALGALYELSSPCMFAPFGTAIVNHSDTTTSPHGKLICLGVNSAHRTGNPTLHGEISAINNCTSILTDPLGEYRLDPSDALQAFTQLSLYTNAEACPMCASAIRWSNFKEYIYGTSIKSLVENGWKQIAIDSEKVFQKARNLSGQTKLFGSVLSNETDIYFGWQFAGGQCPAGCVRYGSSCVDSNA